MIVNIRGTSGSGKSTLLRQLMEARGGATPWMGVDPTRTGKNSTKPVVLGYNTNDLQIGIPGKYVTACGGCDAIKTQDEAQRRIRLLAEQYPHVVFEGLLISHIYGRWAEMARSEYPGQWTFAFLDTPLEVCVERVKARRRASGNEAELDPTNTIQKWHDARRVAAKALSDGHRVHWLGWQTALAELEGLLRVS